ncbi:MAG TPA: MFS transporter [Jatrophihabitans sp.]|nr:MFS transporter [Jatrophihabitans sp.]
MSDRPNGHPSGCEHPWRALAVCLAGGGMVLLDVSIVNVALPSIRTGLSASASALQWVLSGYALTFGLALVPAGRLGDVLGRRRMFLIGLALFTLCSALCGIAQSSLWLALARLAQGLAGGTLTPQISAIIQQLFRGAERGKAFGIFGSVIGISTAIGPLLGGMLIALFGEQEGWRWVFYVNLPVGVLLLPLAARLLPPPRPAGDRRHEELDPVGVLLLGAGVLLLLLPLVQEQQWQTAAKWLLVPVALLVLAAFIGWELRYARTRQPLVPLPLFRFRSYAFGIAIATCYFAGFTPLFFVLTLYLQLGLHYSALLAGLSTIPFALGGGISANLAGRVALRFGRPLVAIGLLLVAVGFVTARIAVAAVPTGPTGWATALPLLLAGVGGGMVISPNQTFTLSEVPERRAGTAGGLLQTGQRIGAAIGIAAVGSVFFAQLHGGPGAGPGAAPNFARAFEVGIELATCFVLLALAIALADVVVDRRVSRTERDAAVPAPQPAARHRT